jgi:phosphoribosylaminoimidazole-succinocarboxamide synthase
MADTTSNDQRRAALAAALHHTVSGLSDPPPTHRGKVRDVYTRGDEVLLVATDRVSAFDVVLGTVPLKGALLTEQATFWLEKASTVAKTHLIERQGGAVMRCRRADAFPVELVVRGFLAGSLMREDPQTRGQVYGLRLDPALAPYAPFETPIITPTTKEAVGDHDRPCSLDELVHSGRLPAAHRDRVVEIALGLFQMGQAHAAENGLILVDTKYELGLIDGEVAVIDELHTADSSRFWAKDTYTERIAAGVAPDMLDKENLRRWLLAKGFSGQGTPPPLDDEIRQGLALHYWDLTERVLGRAISPTPSREDELAAVVRGFLASDD